MKWYFYWRHYVGENALKYDNKTTDQDIETTSIILIIVIMLVKMRTIATAAVPNTTDQIIDTCICVYIGNILWVKMPTSATVAVPKTTGDA